MANGFDDGDGVDSWGGGGIEFFLEVALFHSRPSGELDARCLSTFRSTQCLPATSLLVQPRATPADTTHFVAGRGRGSLLLTRLPPRCPPPFCPPHV